MAKYCPVYSLRCINLLICFMDLFQTNFQQYWFFPGSDAILLGAETLRGLYPVETISTVGRICYEVSLPSYSLHKIILNVFSINYMRSLNDKRSFWYAAFFLILLLYVFCKWLLNTNLECHYCPFYVVNIWQN